LSLGSWRFGAAMQSTSTSVLTIGEAARVSTPLSTGSLGAINIDGTLVVDATPSLAVVDALSLGPSSHLTVGPGADQLEIAELATDEGWLSVEGGPLVALMGADGSLRQLDVSAPFNIDGTGDLEVAELNLSETLAVSGAVTVTVSSGALAGTPSLAIVDQASVIVFDDLLATAVPVPVQLDPAAALALTGDASLDVSGESGSLFILEGNVELSPNGNQVTFAEIALLEGAITVAGRAVRTNLFASEVDDVAGAGTVTVGDSGQLEIASGSPRLGNLIVENNGTFAYEEPGGILHLDAATLSGQFETRSGSGQLIGVAFGSEPVVNGGASWSLDSWTWFASMAPGGLDARLMVLALQLAGGNPIVGAVSAPNGVPGRLTMAEATPEIDWGNGVRPSVILQAAVFEIDDLGLGGPSLTLGNGRLMEVWAGVSTLETLDGDPAALRCETGVVHLAAGAVLAASELVVPVGGGGCTMRLAAQGPSPAERGLLAADLTVANNLTVEVDFEGATGPFTIPGFVVAPGVLGSVSFSSTNLPPGLTADYIESAQRTWDLVLQAQ
jgi:hypothetical protein